MKNMNKIGLISFAFVGLLFGGQANASVIQLGTGAVAQVDGDVAIGDGTNARSGIAQGQNATANGSGCYAVAVGRNASATCVGSPGHGGSVAVGFAANAYYDAIAVGDQAAALRHGVSVGNRSRAVDSATAIGTSAQANTLGSFAGGAGSIAGGDGGYVAINGQALGLASIAIGGVATHTNSIALGDRSRTDRINQLSVGRPGEERVISNVAAGTSPNDAVIYQQVVPAITGIVSGLGGGATYNPATGVMTAPSYVLTAGTFDNVGDALLAIEAGSGGGTDPLAMRYDDASKSTTSLEGATGTQIKNVADGVDPMDAVNRGQLDTVDGRVSDTRSALATNASYFGGGASYDPVSGIMTPPNYAFRDGTNHSNTGSALDNLDARLTILENTPPVAGPQGERGEQGIAGQNGADGRDGVDGTNGADGAQGAQGERGETGSVGPQGPAGQDGADGADGVGGGEAGQDGRDGVDGTNGADGAQGERGDQGLAGLDGQDGINGRSAYEEAIEDGFVGTQSEWLESLKGADGRDGVGGSNVVAGENIEVETNDDDTQTVALSDNVQLSDQGSVQVGATTVNGQGVSIEGGPSMTANGLDAGNKRVLNVSAGRIEQGSTDAVNGGQIYALQDQWNESWTDINNRLDQTNGRIDALGAQSAAMSMMTGAGTYLPVGKVAVSAGVGFYGNKAAFAIGLKARSSERSSWSIGISISPDGKPMGGIGFSHTFGK